MITHMAFIGDLGEGVWEHRDFLAERLGVDPSQVLRADVEVDECRANVTLFDPETYTTRTAEVSWSELTRRS